MTWFRCSIVALVLCLCQASIMHAAETEKTESSASTHHQAATRDIDHLVTLFNPNVWTPDANQKIIVPASDIFTSPASDVARRVQTLTWVSSAIFLPFLILPIVLLLYVIYRFRDRGDGRPAATFSGNHKLEIIWTAIPIFALLLVAYPLWIVLDFMESPPTEGEEPLVVTVVGKQFAWDYEYKEWIDPNAKQKKAISIGQDVAGAQEAIVIPKNRPVVMNYTSNDVNHAWWIPAFGVKKDCITGRFTHAWFTPDRTGVYKGQCAELCGPGHGVMLISAVVVEPSEFEVFLDLCRYRDETLNVWKSLESGASNSDVSRLVGTYLAKGDTPRRRDALRYWVASNSASVLRAPQGALAKQNQADRPQVIAAYRATLEAALSSITTHTQTP